MVTRNGKHKTKIEPQPQGDDEQLACWELCKRTNTTSQMVNKYQALGIVRAPDNRRRGLRQLYDIGYFAEIIAANFLKQFFSLREVAELKKVEHEIRDMWTSGKVMDRTGEAICWKFFFTKELRFGLYKGWEKTADGAKLQDALKRYKKFRATLVERLNPLGERISLKDWEDSLLKRALTGPISVEAGP